MSSKKVKRLIKIATTPVVEPEVVRLLKTENATLRKRLSSKGAIVELIEEAVTTALCDYESPAVPRFKAPRKTSRDVEAAVLHVSDVQFGKVTHSYSSGVAARRMIELAEKVAICVDRHRSYAKIDSLHLYLGGDMVEGELIFPHQAHLIDQSVFDQAVVALPEALATMCRMLLEVVEHLYIKCVCGNHGRPGTKHSGSHPRTNWDRVCYHVLRAFLLGQPGRESKDALKRIHFELPDQFYALSEVEGWWHLIVHGDQIQGQLGIPYYGIHKKAAKWAMSIPRRMSLNDLIKAGLPAQGWHALYLGHFHQYAEGRVADRQWYLNGTTESDNEWALETMGEAGDPVQRLQFWHREHGMVADRPIYLKAGLEER